MTKWKMVLQPNKKYARFVENIQEFTHINLTKFEATALITDLFGTYDVGGVNKKLQAAEKNSNRWNECVEDILKAHGIQAVDELNTDIINEKKNR